MKKFISVLLTIILIFGCLPITSFAAPKSKKYEKNTEGVFFSEKYAQVGVPITVKTKDSNQEFLYKWYINGKEIVNAGDSYTPVEADLECMLTAEIYDACGEKIGAANMFISKLPVIYIETENREPIVQKRKKLKAHMKLQGNSEFNDDSILYDGETEIKGRGNSTWLANKKPYKIKLDTKSDLLGMGKNKHWVLLSNPYDSSLSRNKLIYDLAEDMGISSMSSQWVDVVLNGEVVGNFLLCEHVRIGNTRVDITDWDDIAEDVAKAIYKANKKSMSKAERDELAELMEANMDWVTDGLVTYKSKPTRFLIIITCRTQTADIFWSASAQNRRASPPAAAWVFVSANPRALEKKCSAVFRHITRHLKRQLRPMIFALNITGKK